MSSSTRLLKSQTPKAKLPWHSKRKIKPLPSPTELSSSFKSEIKEYQQSRHRDKDREKGQREEGPHDGNQNELRYRIDQQLAFNQYFVANCDIQYFENKCKSGMPDIFKTIATHCQEVDSSKVQWVLSLRQFKTIQKCLPKPNLFSDKFVGMERKKLHEFRDRTRSKPYHRQSQPYQFKLDPIKPHEIAQAKPYLYDIYHIEVGDRVYVFCPLCCHLHTGSVLSQYKDSYLIKFYEPGLGALKVSESCVSCWMMKQENKVILEEQPQPNSIAGLINMRAFATYMQLIHLKQQYINELRKYNKIFESRNKPRHDQQPCEVAELLQEYGWIGSMINVVQTAIRYIDNCYNVRLSNLVGRDKRPSVHTKMPLLCLAPMYRKLDGLTSSEEAERKNSKKSSKNSQDIIIIQKCQQEIQMRASQQQGQPEEEGGRGGRCQKQ